MDIRNFFFKYRSYTPIPIGIMIVFFARPSSAYLIFGITLLIIGESIRMWAVSYAGGVTRTRNVGAPQLCTSGPYAFVRNPLYVGNMFMYQGVAFIAGIDRILDMARTTVNVTGDAFVSLFIAKSENEFDKDVYNKEAAI